MIGASSIKKILVFIFISNTLLCQDNIIDYAVVKDQTHGMKIYEIQHSLKSKSLLSTKKMYQASWLKNSDSLWLYHRYGENNCLSLANNEGHILKLLYSSPGKRQALRGVSSDDSLMMLYNERDNVNIVIRQTFGQNMVDSFSLSLSHLPYIHNPFYKSGKEIMLKIWQDCEYTNKISGVTKNLSEGIYLYNFNSHQFTLIHANNVFYDDYFYSGYDNVLYLVHTDKIVKLDLNTLKQEDLIHLGSSKKESWITFAKLDETERVLFFEVRRQNRFLWFRLGMEEEECIYFIPSNKVYNVEFDFQKYHEMSFKFLR